MKSLLIGKCILDSNEISKCIQTLQSMNFDDAYQEYSLGIWKTKTLWNMSGLEHQSVSIEYVGSAQKTPSAIALPYLNQLIEKSFNLPLIKSVRIFHSSSGGLIVPHRDYMEFKNGFKRFHLVIKTDKTCLNSEENTVYHMQEGELWFLEGRLTHSAASFSESGKYSLVIDFDPSIEIQEIFNRNHNFQFDQLSPFIITHREKLSVSLINSLMDLGTVITPFNFRSVFHLLCQLHFEYEISGDEVYTYLHNIAMRSKRLDIMHLYQHVERIFLTHGPEWERKSA